MADPIWPESLPTPLLSGFGVSDDLPLIRTRMESGPDRVTRTSSTFMTNISFKLLLTASQYAEFRQFFETNCNAGADWFSIPLDTAGSVVYHRARFKKSPKYSIERPFYRLSCQVETDERHITWS